MGGKLADPEGWQSGRKVVARQGRSSRPVGGGVEPPVVQKALTGKGLLARGHCQGGKHNFGWTLLGGDPKFEGSGRKRKITGAQQF